MAFEYPILDWFQSLHTPLLSALAVFFDKAGAHGEIWIVFAVLLLIFPRTRKAGRHGSVPSALSDRRRLLP